MTTSFDVDGRLGRMVPALAAGLAISASALPAMAQGPNSGADVIVGSLSDTSHYGSIGGIHAYSVGTTSCNAGNQPLEWFASINRHPVIGQNMFRISNGAIEQIGQSWLKHGFAALQGNLCFSCQAFPNSTQLGPGCSDPYGSGLNGSQSGLGPRFQVNATTGLYSYPFFAQGSTGNTIYKRLQVAESDLTVPGAQYLVEGHYIAPDDAEQENDDNNASYRRVSVSGGFNLSFQGGTVREKAAIFAWQDHGLGPNTPDPDVFIVPLKDQSGGLFHLGYKVSDNGNGTWRYEYAIQNLNSDRSGQAFRVPHPAGVNVTNMGFHDVAYHSGEPFSGTDWTMTETATECVFATETEAVNPNANALRWGTLYNFRFDADQPPVAGQVHLDLFKSGSPAVASQVVQVPGAPDCLVDFAEPFGTLDFFDALAFFALFDVQDPAADLSAPFGVWDFFDVQEFLNLFDAGCP